MGFGLLFIGYLFLFNFPLRNYFALDMIPDLVGYVILFFALSKLKLYIDKMRYARLVLIPMLCLAVFRFVFVFLSYFGIYNGTNLINAVWYVENGLIFAFHILLLRGICDIAKETGLPKLCVRGKRNLICIVLYYLAYFTEAIFAKSSSAALQWARVITLLAGLWFVLLCAMLIFSCYMWICLPEDLNMESKRRFPFPRKPDDTP